MSKDDKARAAQRINIELGETEAQGHYANVSLINFSPSEFVLDFARVVPGVQKARVQSRVIMTPPNAKLLMRTLEQQVERYESMHGKLPDPAAKQGGTSFNISGGEIPS